MGRAPILVRAPALQKVGPGCNGPTTVADHAGPTETPLVPARSAGPEETLVRSLALLNITFYFLPFHFYYMSNVYNTHLNHYKTTSLRGKKVNQ